MLRPLHPSLTLPPPPSHPIILFPLLPTYALYKSLRVRSPPRLLHNTITILSLTSAIFAVILAITWVRSYKFDLDLTTDKAFFENHAWFFSRRGITCWYFFDEPLELQTFKLHRSTVDQGGYLLVGAMDPAFRFLGFGRTKSTYIHSSLFSG